MRILICTGIYPPDIGGPATYSKLLKDELPKYGFEVGVLSFGEVRRFPKIIRHIIYFFKVLKRSFEADVIFAQDPVSVGLPSVLAAKFLNKKFLLKVVGDYAWEQGSQRFGIKDNLDIFLGQRYGFFVEILRKIERFVSKKADLIIAPSVYLKSVIEKWGIRSEKIKVIYNAFELPEIQKLNSNVIKNAKNEAKRELGLDGFILLSIGRLVPWKGFLALIKSVSKLKDEIKDLKLVIIGSGPDYGALEAEIERSNLKKFVSLYGQMEHKKIFEYLSVCDIFILNTSYEGLSHQLLEAMAIMEKPIITTRAGGNPELIEDKKSGIFIEYNNKDQIVEAVKLLYEDRDMGRRLSQKAREKAREFSKEKMINNISDVLLSL